MSYRTNCRMYDEVSMGNPGGVPYCAMTGMLEPKCDKCYRPIFTKADQIRSMSDEELANYLSKQQYYARLTGAWSRDTWLEILKAEADT